MLLTNIGLINWHTYGTIDVSVSGNGIGIIGDNGAGKSTLLDALYVLLTGGTEVKLNRRAADNKSGEAPGIKRTIHSYCLGRLNTDSTVRDESNTYLLAGFEDPSGKKQPVTLLLAFHASRDNNRQHLEARAIIKNMLVRTSDIVRKNDAGDLIADTWNETRTRLEATIKAAKGSISFHMASAKEYIQSYMLAMMYRGRYDNQPQFIKNLENGIAFNAVGSATDFVQRYVLPDSPIDINALRSSAATFNKLVEQVKLVRMQISVLESLTASLEKRRQDEATEAEEKAIVAMAAASISRRKRRSLIRSKNKAEKELARKSAELAKIKEEITEADQEIKSLHDRRRGLADASRIELLQKQVTELRTSLDQTMARLLGGNGLGRVAHTIRYKLAQTSMPASLKNAFVKLNEAVNGSGQSTEEYIPQDLAGADTAYRTAKKELVDGKADIERNLHRLTQTIEDLKNERTDLEASITNLSENRHNYDRATTDFINEIGCRGIAAEVLCNVLEIEDESWRDAVERLLGSNRDTVFVKPSDYAAALSVIDDNQKTFGRVILASTVKLARHQIRPRAGTLADVLVPGNDVVAAFIDRKFGSVQLAETRSDFTRDGRWLLRSGLYDDGTASRALSPTMPKIGRKGALQGLPMLKKRQEEVNEQLSGLIAKEQESRVLAGAIQRFERIVEEIGEVDAPFAALKHDWDVNSERIRQAEDDIEAIEDSSEGEGLDKEINDCLLHKDDLEKQREELLKVVYGLGRDIDETNKQLDGGEADIGSRANVSKANSLYRTAIGLVPEVNRWNYHLTFFSRLSDENEPARIRHNAAASAREAVERLRDSLHDIKIESGRCIDLCGARNVIPERMDLMDDVRPWAVSMLYELQNDRLLEHESMLEQCRKRSDELFKAGFVNELASKFADVRRQINDLNFVIKGTKFLGEVYKIKMFPAPGREAFHVVVKNQDEVNTATVGGGLFMTTASPEVQAAMDEIKETIFSPDVTVDLDEFTDYRRYFAFDLEITNEETGVVNTLRSRQGAGSGGERQTPYYICMMAAMSNIYYGGPYKDLKPGDGGLCLAIFDEAFSNMDGKVTGQTIELGRSLGLQLMLCAPSDKKVILQRNCETVLTVVKSSDARRTSIFAQHLHHCARDELKAIDPSLKTEAEIASMMGERAARV